MARFVVGLVLDACGSGIAWATSHDRGITLIVGLVVLVLVWLGELILDDLL